MTGEAAGDPRGVRGRGPVMGRRRRLGLRSVRGAVGKGRDFTRRTLRDWGWDGRESAEDALLVVSELVTNAALHAHGCEELVLTAGETLRIEVLDGVAALPRPGAARHPGVPGGHGLYLVRRLSDRWGCYPLGTGKVVWAEIESSRLAAGCPQSPGPGPGRS
ncbi:ATP-binding protein [Streptomyces sp. NBC_01264]|uniref:ATP-binding protein n=1 Tax=Streptomyces sp. NBC_01264 TaxID=2903804 RepID=UPI002259A0D5|nr:ATP-binding protein [Streptomyces sp. NBC_01264]MCX4782240.1 ATP-binding protein [Streptomyces sp. NBC_01264]